jgi:hypothetical protein
VVAHRDDHWPPIHDEADVCNQALLEDGLGLVSDCALRVSPNPGSFGDTQRLTSEAMVG